MFWLFLLFYLSYEATSEQNFNCTFPSPMYPFFIVHSRDFNTSTEMQQTCIFKSCHLYFTSSKRFCIPRHSDRGCCSNVLKIIKLLVYHIFLMVISNIQRIRKRFPILLQPPSLSLIFSPNIVKYLKVLQPLNDKDTKVSSKSLYYTL